MNLGIDGGLNPPLFVFVLVSVLVLVFFISLNLGIDGGLNPPHLFGLVLVLVLVIVLSFSYLLNLGIDGGLNPPHLFGLHCQPQLHTILCQCPETNRNAQCILAEIFYHKMHFQKKEILQKCL